MQRAQHASRWFHAVWCLVALVVVGSAPPARADAPLPPLPAVFSKPAPTSVAELKEMQDRVQLVIKRVMPAVVNVKVGSGQGSGVIISEDGYVLTAGHVSGTPGQKVQVTLADGRHVKGVTLGGNRIVDSGLIKITDSGKWPVAELGDSTALRKGDWCLCLGHPGGIQPGRDPVARLGRVLDNFKDVIRTDCTLVGGDSGGPLFDMNGRVIGIHSRIMLFTYQNYHVPVKQYKTDWARLVKSDLIFPAYLGVKRDPNDKSCKIAEVLPQSAAAKAGLKENDVITKLSGKTIKTFEDLANTIGNMRSGDQVTVEVQRGNSVVTLNVVLGAFKK